MRVLILPALLALTACASMSPEECDATDWRYRGYSTGSVGGLSTEDDGRFVQCAEAGVRGDRAAYRAGYEEGLATYCTFEGVLSAALRGQGDVLRCPDPTYAMEEAYEVGFALHSAERDRNAAEAAFEDATGNFRRALREADRLAAKIPQIDDPARRDELRREIDRLRSQAFREERRADEARYAVRRASDRLYDAERRYERLRLRTRELKRLDAQERTNRDAAD